MDHSGDSLIAIGTVAREIGIPRETLRIWERRYGWPQPSRATDGERHYSQADIAKLRLIKQLLDRGLGPGKLIRQSEAELRALIASIAAPEGAGAAKLPGIELALDLVKRRRIGDLQQWFRRSLAEQGLRHFVLETARPLCKAVGYAWECGDFAVFEEHMVTEQLQILLRGAITAAALPDGSPRVLMTTLPGEAHGIGLLMLQALLNVEGADCLSLGLQTPVADIVACCRAEAFDVVALSFSACFPGRRVGPALSELRGTLDPAVRLWAGGAGTVHAAGRRRPDGVALMKSLEEASAAIREARAERA